MGWDAIYGLPMTREQLERRRMSAAGDLRRGVRQAEVARKYGVSGASASRWAKALRQGGREALRSRPIRGAAPRLTDDQKGALLRRLAEGATAHGWSTDLWTTKRVATLIGREFGVRYNANYVAELLHGLGWSWHKPRRRAREKDEDLKRTWLRTTWRRIRKN